MTKVTVKAPSKPKHARFGALRAVAEIAFARARMRPFPPHPRRIAVLKLDHIGDLAMSVPAIRRISVAFPESEVILFCSSLTAPFARSMLRNVRVEEADVFAARVSETALDPSLAALSGHGTFDAGIDLRYFPETRPLLARSGATWICGYGTDSVALDMSLPPKRMARLLPRMADRIDALTDAFLLAAGRLAWRRPARALNHAGDGPIVIAPGSGNDVKRWPQDRWASLIRGLLVNHPQRRIVLAGAPHERAVADLIAAEVADQRLENRVGATTLVEIGSLLQSSALFIGNDSGPAHIAGLVGAPIVVIFGGQDRPEVWAPHGPKVRVLAHPPACSPCHLRRAADCAFDLACLRAVSVEEVLAAALDTLAAE